MPTYVTEIAYVSTTEDIDWREVRAGTRAEAIALATKQFLREAFGNLRDAAIVSVTAQEIPERRYRLNLSSDRLDLDAEEVR